MSATIPADHPFAESTEAALAIVLAKPVKDRTEANRRDIVRLRTKSRKLDRQARAEMAKTLPEHLAQVRDEDVRSARKFEGL